MRQSMAPRQGFGSGSGSGSGADQLDMGTQRRTGLASTPSASAQTPTSTSASTSTSTLPTTAQSTLASPPLHRSSRPPALYAASLASGPASSSAAPPHRLSFPSSPFATSPAAVSPSAPAFAPSSAAAVAVAAALSSSSASTARPILPPLPPLPQVSPLSRYLSERPQPSEFTSSRPFPVSLDGTNNLTTLQPDPYLPLNSPLSRYPLLPPQSSAFWSAYRSQLDLPNEWPQDDSAATNVSVLAARAFGFNLNDFTSSFAPFISQPPLLQSPSHPPRHSPDLRFPFDLGNLPAPPPAANSTSAASLAEPLPSAAAAPAPSTASVAPSSRHLHQNRAARTTNTSRVNATTTYNSASPPTSGQGLAHLSNPAEAAFDSDNNSVLDEFFCDLDGFPGFPLPIPEAADTDSPSASGTMPTTSRRTLRNRDLPEATDSSASTTNASKRRRVTPSAAQPTSLQTVIDDEEGEWPLFGSSPSRPGSSSDLKNEDYTTIDLTEVNDVPEELKKPEVDNRVKLSAFQCVICMDDVTGLTLTHCGHLFCAQCLYSSLSIESTRGKCPMCRAKIDMKPRENYSVKTKGYWPLELKLMTRTRQGKRKAQAME
ncbi:hypothetical protein V8C42DRAFT_247762 [Trichoderma barbatum]